MQNLYNFRQSRGRATEEQCREVIGDITGTIAHAMLKRFGTTMQLSEPRIFSTVPDDPIEMPPPFSSSRFVWRKEHAYFVLGLASSDNFASS